MTISSLHRMTLSFEKLDEPVYDSLDRIFRCIENVTDEPLKPRSTATEIFLREGTVPVDTTLRLGTNFLDSLSPDEASWISIRPIDSRKMHTQYFSISTILSYSIKNHNIQKKISKNIVKTISDKLNPNFCLCNIKDIDDESFMCLPDVKEIDGDIELLFLSPIMFVSSSWCSDTMLSAIKNGIGVDHIQAHARGFYIDYVDADVWRFIPEAKVRVSEISDHKITMLSPQALST